MKRNFIAWFCLYFFSSSELLRVIDSLQLTATKKVATPADWEVRMAEQILLDTLIKFIHSFIHIKNPNQIILISITLCACVQ